MQTLYKAIAKLRKTRIVENSSLVANEKDGQGVKGDVRDIVIKKKILNGKLV